MEEKIKQMAESYGLTYDTYQKIINMYDSYDEEDGDLTVTGLDIEKEVNKSVSKVKLLTGIPEIDDLTKGLSTGVHVIAGFRKCCKSTYALNLIYKAINEGNNVCLLSLEMSKIDVLNTLISLHSYELDSKTAVSRTELSMLLELDKEKYNDYLYSFLSLPGNLIIFTEKDIIENSKYVCASAYSNRNLDSLFDKANRSCIIKTGKEVQMLVVDNINCIRVWDKKTSGEQAYTSASNYFRQVALNFGKYQDDLKCGGKPVILLLLAQINRSGGKEALYNGFYPESSIAETVNIERDATTIIPIYTNQQYIESNYAFIKLEASRYSPAMLEPTDIPVNLEYGKIGYPLEKINVDESKKMILLQKDKFKMVKVEDETGKVLKIVIPKSGSIPVGYKECTNGSLFWDDDDDE